MIFCGPTYEFLMVLVTKFCDQMIQILKIWKYMCTIDPLGVGTIGAAKTKISKIVRASYGKTVRTPFRYIRVYRTHSRNRNFMVFCGLFIFWCTVHHLQILWLILWIFTAWDMNFVVGLFDEFSLLLLQTFLVLLMNFCCYFHKKKLVLFIRSNFLWYSLRIFMVQYTNFCFPTALCMCAFHYKRQASPAPSPHPLELMSRSKTRSKSTTENSISKLLLLRKNKAG